MDVRLDNGVGTSPSFGGVEAEAVPMCNAETADDSDSEDLGPETAVDVDADDQDLDGAPNHPSEHPHETPTPPAHAVEGARGGDLVDNVGESGEDSEEDEWNYYKGDNKANEEPESAQQDNCGWDSSSGEMNSSPLNPEAPVFVPGADAPMAESPAPAARSPTPVPLPGADVIIAQSPRKPLPMEDVELPNLAQFETEATTRPADLLDNSDHLNGHHNLSFNENNEQINGNDSCTMDQMELGFKTDIATEKMQEADLLQDFERVQKDTTDFCNIQVAFTHGDTDPIADVDEELFERLKSKERDPMSMSFYQEKDDDTSVLNPKPTHPVDLNAVQLLPDSENDDELEISPQDDKENIMPDNDAIIVSAETATQSCDTNIIDTAADEPIPAENVFLLDSIESTLATSTPESHKLLFEQIPEIPDGKGSDTDFVTEHKSVDLANDFVAEHEPVDLVNDFVAEHKPIDLVYEANIQIDCQSVDDHDIAQKDIVSETNEVDNEVTPQPPEPSSPLPIPGDNIDLLEPELNIQELASTDDKVSRETYNIVNTNLKVTDLDAAISESELAFETPRSIESTETFLTNNTSETSREDLENCKDVESSETTDYNQFEKQDTEEIKPFMTEHAYSEDLVELKQQEIDKVNAVVNELDISDLGHKFENLDMNCDKTSSDTSTQNFIGSLSKPQEHDIEVPTHLNSEETLNLLTSIENTKIVPEIQNEILDSNVLIPSHFELETVKESHAQEICVPESNEISIPTEDLLVGQFESQENSNETTATPPPTPAVDAIAPQLYEIPPQLDAIPPQLDAIPPKFDAIPPELNEIPPQLDALPLEFDAVPPQLDANTETASLIASLGKKETEVTPDKTAELVTAAIATAAVGTAAAVAATKSKTPLSKPKTPTTKTPAAKTAPKVASTTPKTTSAPKKAPTPISKTPISARPVPTATSASKLSSTKTTPRAAVTAKASDVTKENLVAKTARPAPSKTTTSAAKITAKTVSDKPSTITKSTTVPKATSAITKLSTTTTKTTSTVQKTTSSVLKAAPRIPAAKPLSSTEVSKTKPAVGLTRTVPKVGEKKPLNAVTEKKTMPLMNGDVKKSIPSVTARPPPKTAPVRVASTTTQSKVSSRPAASARPAAGAPAAPASTRAVLDKTGKDMANRRISAAAPPKTLASKTAAKPPPPKEPVKKAVTKRIKDPAAVAALQATAPLTNGSADPETAKPLSPPAVDNALLPDVIA